MVESINTFGGVDELQNKVLK
jgi:phenylalanyl-tRNA synthetase alpha chain